MKIKSVLLTLVYTSLLTLSAPALSNGFNIYLAQVGTEALTAIVSGTTFEVGKSGDTCRFKARTGAVTSTLSGNVGIKTNRNRTNGVGGKGVGIIERKDICLVRTK